MCLHYSFMLSVKDISYSGHESRQLLFLIFNLVSVAQSEIVCVHDWCCLKHFLMEYIINILKWINNSAWNCWCGGSSVLYGTNVCHCLGGAQSNQCCWLAALLCILTRRKWTTCSHPEHFRVDTMLALNKWEKKVHLSL